MESRHETRGGYYTKVCQHCGDIFSAKDSKAKYGSGACRMAASRARNKVEAPKAYCRWCGQPFYPDSAKAVYDKPACKQAAYRARIGAGKQAMF